MRTTYLALLTFSAVTAATAQTPLGFSSAAAAREDSVERLLLAVPDTASVRAMSRALSARPHLAGSPQQAVTRDYVLEKLRAWGLDSVWSQAYDVYIPMPDTVQAWFTPRAGAAAQRLALGEPLIGTTPGPAVPPFNGYTGDGDATAEAVYVNYGLIDDYRVLDSLGVSVKGKIAIARYGRSFRGIKAREAERHGAIGLIIYSDPQDDGYFRGDVYPTGPMRPPFGIQRGSILNVNGDPTTPGYASLPGAHRLPEESLPVPHIPVVPMGYGNAQRILGVLAGGSLPQGWQGALPFRYHAGPGPGPRDASDLGHVRYDPRYHRTRRVGDRGRAPRRVVAGDRRQHLRHSHGARGGARVRAAGAARHPAGAHADFRNVGRRRVGSDRLDRVDRADGRSVGRARRRLHQ
jgi:N-acetylated-alpha-linked acidic dipeptidase